MAWALPTPWTVEDFDRLPEDTYGYELLEGTLIMSPAPGLLHQLVVGNLFMRLAKAAPPSQVVFVTPVDWEISARTVLEPDMTVARDEDLAPPGPLERGAKRLTRPPVLAIEVISPSPRGYDLETKRSLYAAGGLDDYWVIDPDVPSLTVFERDASGVLRRVAEVTGDDEYAATLPFPVTIVPAELVRRPTS